MLYRVSGGDIDGAAEAILANRKRIKMVPRCRALSAKESAAHADAVSRVQAILHCWLIELSGHWVNNESYNKHFRMSRKFSLFPRGTSTIDKKFIFNPLLRDLMLLKLVRVEWLL